MEENKKNISDNVSDTNDHDFDLESEAAKHGDINDSKNDAKQTQTKNDNGKIHVIAKSFDSPVDAINGLLNSLIGPNDECDDDEDEDEDIVETINGLHANLAKHKNTTIGSLLDENNRYSLSASLMYEPAAQLDLLDFDAIEYTSVTSMSSYMLNVFNLNINDRINNAFHIPFKKLYNKLPEITQLLLDSVLCSEKSQLKIQSYNVAMYLYVDKDHDTMLCPVSIYKKGGKYGNSVIGLLYINKHNNLDIYLPRYCNLESNIILRNISSFNSDFDNSFVAEYIYMSRLIELTEIYALAFKPHISETAFSISNIGKYSRHGDTRTKSYNMDGNSICRIGKIIVNDDTEEAKQFRNKYYVNSNNSIDLYFMFKHTPNDILIGIVRNINFNNVFNNARLRFLDSNALLIDIGI